MFADINTNSAQRITEIREYLDFINPLIPAPPTATPRYLNTAKGLVYVQLYGVIESTINSTVSKTIFCINSDTISLLDLQPLVMSMALNPELDSLNNANKKKWDKRAELFQKYNDNKQVNIANDIMPTNGENFHMPQLHSIWKTFSITEPLFNDNSFRGRLLDIVTNRINIAHGNNSAADIGSRVTCIELYDRLQEVSNYCSYFISVFEDYIQNKRYLR